MSGIVQCDTDHRGVATLTLNRPDKHNALNGEMIELLAERATQLGRDNSVRVVVLAGAGKSFCAGGDLNWMKDQMAADDKTRTHEARKLATMLGVLNTLPKPLIGRIHGNAFGGGVGLASICDVAIASDSARFGLTETRLGLIPATIGPYVIARMGEANARRVFMSSRIFKADEAVRLGIVANAVSPGDLDEAIDAEITPYFDCAPGAVAAAKALARHLGPRIDEALIDESISALLNRWQSDEARHGIEAFFARTPAPWVKKH